MVVGRRRVLVTLFTLITVLSAAGPWGLGPSAQANEPSPAPTESPSPTPPDTGDETPAPTTSPEPSLEPSPEPSPTPDPSGAATGALAGRLTDWQGAGLPNGYISACLLPASDPCLYTHTNEMGAFELADMAAGEWRVTGADEMWMSSVAEQVTIIAGQTTNEDIVIPARLVQGTLTGPTGPVSGADVHLCADRGTGYCQSTYSYADGEFAFTGMDFGEYEVLYRLPGQISPRSAGYVTVGYEPVFVPISVSDQRVSGTVTDSGAPLAGASLELCQFRPEEGSNCVAATGVRANGSYAFAYVPAGSWYIWVQTGGTVRHVEPVEVADEPVILHIALGDPTPTPEPTPDWTPEPTPDWTPDPTSDPTPTPTPTPTPPDGPDACGTVSGQVRHADGTPIAAASVRLVNADLSWLADTVTDASGNYSMAFVPQETFWVHAFVDDIQRLTVVGGDSGISLGCASGVFDVEVGSGGVSGVLTDANGNPAAGYYVQVCGFYYAGLQYCHEPQTGADGSYSVLYLRPGNNTVRVLDSSGPLELTVGSSVAIAIDSTVQPLDLQLAGNGATPTSTPSPTPTPTPTAQPATGSVSGTFTVEGVGPLADTWVFLYAADFRSEVSVQTDAAGAYTFSGVAAGNYRLAASANEYRRDVWTAEFSVDSDAVTVNLVLPSTGVTGVLTDSSGAAAPGLGVMACGWHPGDLGWCYYDETDSNGVYELLYLPGTEIELSVRTIQDWQPLDLSTGPSQAASLSGTLDTVNLQLAPLSSVTGAVKFADGTAAGAWVYVQKVGYGSVRETYTADGSYAFSGLGAGDYYLHAWVPSISRNVIGATVALAPGANVVDLPIPTGGLTGHVADWNGGDAVGVAVEACGMHAGQAFEWCYSSETDAEGNYAIPHLDSGTATIRVRDSSGVLLGLTTGQTATATVDDTMQTFDLTLTPPVSVYGRITYPDGSPISGVPVYLVTSGGGGIAASTSTNDSGDYELTHVQPGDYFVSAYVSSENRSILTADFNVAADSVEKSLSLPAGGVSGFVSLADGSAADNVRVGFCGVYPGTFSSWCHEDTTDGTGYYEVPFLDAVDATLYVRSASGHDLELADGSQYQISLGSTMQTLDVQLAPFDACDFPQGTPGPGETPMPCESPQPTEEPTPSPSPSLSGYVREASGQTVADALVMVDLDGTVLYSTATDANGYYELAWLPEAMDFRLCAQTDSGSVCEAFTTTGSPQVIDLWFPAGESGYVFGTVTASDGGELYGAYINICSDPDCNDWVDQIEVSETGDPNVWQYQTNSLPAGEYHLLVYPYSNDYSRFTVDQTVVVVVGDGATEQNLVIEIAPTTTVQGHITFANGGPAAGVYVAACFQHTPCTAGGWNVGVGDGAAYGRTDANGFYQLLNVPVIADKGAISYRPADNGVNVASHTGGFASPLHVHNIVIDRPSGGVNGQFLYADGSPVVGADISWYELGEGATDDGGAYVQPTDSQGRFVIRGLEPGTYRITGEDHASRRNVSAVVTIDANIEPLTLQHDPLPTGGLRGTVVDHLGNRVPEADVEFCYATSEESGACGYTRADDDGVFEILFLPPFVVSGTIYHPDGDRWVDFRQTLGDEVTEVTYTLPQPPTAVITGTFTVDGQPEPYAFFRVCSAVRCHWVEADESSRFEVGPLAPGTYIFKLGRFEDSAGPIEVGYESFEHDVAIELPTGGIHGTVTSNGAPVTEVDMSACSADGCISGSTNDIGDYQFSLLPPGDYHIVIHRGGDFADPNSPVTVGTTIVDSHDIDISGGSISGNVLAGGEPASFAWVQACRDGFGCIGSSADELGQFVITLLADGVYTIRAHPSSGGFLPTTSANAVTVTDGSAESAGTIELTQLETLPEDGSTTLSGEGVMDAEPGAVPSVWANTPISLRTTGCAGGTASYTITSVYDPGHVLTGSLSETTAGTYEAQIVFDFGGPALVELALACPNPAESTEVSFNVYIDPSGWVRDTLGDPIVGATVVLYRAPTPAGPWEQVPDGSEIMSPNNRTNPDLTDAEGHFGWDVVAGYYKVRATATGCVDPNDRLQPYVDTIAYKIPPPVMDIDLRMFCGESEATDETDPTVTITTPADGADYALGSTVLADYACADEDGGSGLVSCVGDVAHGAAIDTATLGSHSFTVTATDAAGNVGTATVTYDVVDAVKPTVTLTTPANGADYVLGSTVAADYACADEAGGSGLASCVGNVADGAAIDTSTVGTRSFSVTATDVAGNETTESVTYRVLYAFGGFQKLDPAPAFNSAAAGGNLSIAFSLGGNHGLAAVTNAASRQVACTSGTPIGGLVTDGMGRVIFEDGRYKLGWKTDKAWAGTCREVVVSLADGTQHSVLFAFANKGRK